MPFQFNEYYNGTTGLTVGVNRVLFHEKSPYQTVEVFETDTWGNMMTIDGIVMLSEKDEFVYHEMITHPALLTHPNPKRVLIIGGGDGGTAREVLKHKSIETVDLVEIDETVVRAAKLYLPQVGDFNNPKLNVRYEDGIAFIKNVTEPYDIIIIDGSDPIGPAEGLFQKQFYQDCWNALSENGILTAQSESPFVEKFNHGLVSIMNATRSIFKISKLYTAFIPLYHTGFWTMTFASKQIDPHSPEVLARVKSGLKSLESGLKYYNEDMHVGAFAIPNFVKRLIS